MIKALAAATAGDQVGVGAGNTVEKLAKDHRLTPVLSTL
jgi:hypothetical protein